MERFLGALICSVLLLTGCTKGYETGSAQSNSNSHVAQPGETSTISPDYNLGDQALLQYVEDSIYTSVIEELNSDDYEIEHVVAAYVSKEYLEELNYNSQENIYFGYKLSDIEAKYEGTRYVFALDNEGDTEVRAFEAYDDTYDQVLKNVAVGTGVILVAVTVSMVAGTIATPAAATVSTVFMVSAVTGTQVALSSGTLGGIASGIITGFETSDPEAAFKSAVLGASEGFKWGAITGVVAGGATELLRIGRASTSTIRSPRDSELYAFKKYGGWEQESFLGGKKVTWGTPGSTRPDIVRTVNGRLEAIEVKNYDLKVSLKLLITELKRQISQRNIDLPDGAIQRVVLDVAGRGHSQKFLNKVRDEIIKELNPIYPKIPLDFLR